MKSVSAVSILAVAAVATAQSSSLIPSGINSSCSSFLQDFNSNSTITGCLTKIVDATKSFGPLGSSSGSFSAGDVSSALNSLCSSSSTCPSTTMHSLLASYYSACSGDMGNQDVRTIYESLYMLAPFQTAVCSKSDSGQYCVTQIPSSSASGSSAASSAASSAVSSPAPSSSAPAKRADETTNVTSAIIPNTSAFGSSNLAFLFFNPSMPSTKLCTSCLRSVMSPYIALEQQVPYGPGDISQSPMLGGQNALYNAATQQCGSNFFSGSVEAAGGLSGGLVGSSSGALPQFSAASGVFGVAAAAAVGLSALL